MAQGIIVKVKYEMKPGTREEFCQKVAEGLIAEKTRAETGNVKYEYRIQEGEPDNLYLTEMWTDEDLWNLHYETEHYKELAVLKDQYVVKTEIEKSPFVVNETLQVLENRRSCRNFKPDMIKEEELQAVLRAGTFAPTGMGKQSPIIIAVTNKEMRDAIAEENRKIGGWEEGFDPFYGAPVILIVLSNTAINKKIGTYMNDGSLVMGNLLNAAASIGLGSIWIHRAKEEFSSEFGKEILKNLGIEGEYEGIAHCALGYEAEPAKEAAPRKENYVYYIR